mmetsp:Transcript_56871/g.166518  ORF Transcript_56871/g.166518 Transcript_56871/m.166518 type:complete len:235 (+) Transcript_56871:925-1629(+)
MATGARERHERAGTSLLGHRGGATARLCGRGAQTPPVHGPVLRRQTPESAWDWLKCSTERTDGVQPGPWTGEHSGQQPSHATTAWLGPCTRAWCRAANAPSDWHWPTEAHLAAGWSGKNARPRYGGTDEPPAWLGGQLSGGAWKSDQTTNGGWLSRKPGDGPTNQATAGSWSHAQGSHGSADTATDECCPRTKFGQCGDCNQSANVLASIQLLKDHTWTESRSQCWTSTPGAIR